jgi:DNA-binding protein HU-beta
MTKAELVTIIARSAGGSRPAADRALTAFVTAIRESLRQGRPVTISGFGTFVVARRGARRGRNPRDGSPMAIPGARVPRFRPSRALRLSVR